MIAATSGGDLDARRKQLLTEMHPLPQRLFAVVSWGCAGTRWLANVLNDHPGVFCLHAGNTFWTEFAGAKRLDGVAYLELIGLMGSAATVVGDVHGISRADVPHIRHAFGERFRAAVLVRDPLPRLRSQMALFGELAEVQIWNVEYLRDKFPDALQLLPTGSYQELLYVHGVNMLNAILEEVEVGPIVRMEDVTTDAGALCKLLSHLTHGSITISEAWASSAVGAPRTNEHSGGRHSQLATWQRNVLATVLDPRATAMYERLGYSSLFELR